MKAIAVTVRAGIPLISLRTRPREGGQGFEDNMLLGEIGDTFRKVDEVLD